MTEQELIAEVKRLRDLLRDLEWCGESYRTGDPEIACVHCLGPKRLGHNEGCQLAAALEKK